MVGDSGIDVASKALIIVAGCASIAIARALGGIAQAQAALLHGLIVSASSLRKHITQGFVQRVPR